MPHWTSLLTLLAAAVYFGAALRVGMARGTYKIKAPATTGDPNFERVYRAHQNMLEWMPIFLPSLWLFALTLSDRWAALVGLVWVAGRVLYLVTYAEAADRRGRGFAIQAPGAGVLFRGSLVGVGKALIAG